MCSPGGVFRTNEVGHDCGHNIEPALTRPVANVDQQVKFHMKSAGTETVHFFLKVRLGPRVEMCSFPAPAGAAAPIIPQPPPQELLTVSDHSYTHKAKPSENGFNGLTLSVLNHLKRKNVPKAYREMKVTLLNGGTTVQLVSTENGLEALILSVWNDIAKKDVPKAHRLMNMSLKVKQSNAKKTVQLASTEARLWKTRSTKASKVIKKEAKKRMREAPTGFEHADYRCLSFGGRNVIY